MAASGWGKSMLMHLMAGLDPVGKRETCTVRGVLDEGSDLDLLADGLVVPSDRLGSGFDAPDNEFVFLRFADGAPATQVRAVLRAPACE